MKYPSCLLVSPSAWKKNQLLHLQTTAVCYHRQKSTFSAFTCFIMYFFLLSDSFLSTVVSVLNKKRVVVKV